MDRIDIKGIAFYGHHGLSELEQKLGQKFLVDIEMYLDLTEAGKSDDLSKSVDYTQVYKVIKKIEKEKNYKLIEALTFNIAEAILKYFDLVKEVKVIVKKTNVPMEGIVDHVACHISRKKRI